MHSGEVPDDRLLQRSPAGGLHGVATGADAFRNMFEEDGVEALAYMDSVSLGLIAVTQSRPEHFGLPPVRAGRY